MFKNSLEFDWLESEVKTRQLVTKMLSELESKLPFLMRIILDS